MTTTTADEIRAWLDDPNMPDDRARGLADLFDEINARIHPDLEDERNAARIAAYRTLAGERDDEIEKLTTELARARRAEAEALAGLRQIATMDRARGLSLNAISDALGVDWRTVRGWLRGA